MFNVSTQTMRKLVKFTSSLFLNKRCPLWLQRKGLNALGGYNRLPPSVSVNKQTLGDRPAWWFNLNQQPTKHVILYFHGGGYGIGSPRSHRDLCAYLAKYSGLSVISLDYRLAPEHPYPAALEDALAAFQALLSQGIAAKPHSRWQAIQPVAAWALSLSLRLKSEGLPQPGCQFLISPWVNKSRETSESQNPIPTSIL